MTNSPKNPVTREEYMLAALAEIAKTLQALLTMQKDNLARGTAASALVQVEEFIDRAINPPAI